jgi:hypothetical protein
MERHIFSIAEICLGVVEWVLQPEELGDRDCSHPRLGTIAALARVSRTFYDPAVNVLWRGLNDAVPLVRLLPQEHFALVDGVWEYTGGNTEARTRSLPLSPTLEL